MAGLQIGKKEKDGKASLQKRGTAVVERKSMFGRYTDAEMLAKLRELALAPYNPEMSKDKIRPLWNQVLRVRNVMALNDTELPRRKRKLQQFVKDELRIVPKLANISSYQDSTKLGKGQLSHASSVPCMLNSVDSTSSFDCSSNSLLTYEGNFQSKKVLSESSFLGNASDWDAPRKDDSSLINSDESVNGSNPLTPENLTPNEPNSLQLDDVIHNLKPPASEGSNRKHLQPPRRSIRLLNFIGDHLQQVVVPIGPRFQVDVPEWTGPANKGNIYGQYNDSESSRWLGTRVWPIEIGNMKASRTVGKGRPETCSCMSPGSIDCTRRHVLEERLLLQCDLGPAFFDWKFDEMGEQVLKSWTWKEQQTLESLMSMKPSSSRKSFPKLAFKFFPNKSRKTIINCYFNVFLPRYMSLQTRSSQEPFDTDDDEAENCRSKDLAKCVQGNSVARANSEDINMDTFFSLPN